MTVNSQDFDFIRQFVMQRSAIMLEPEKGYLVEARLMPLVRQEGLSSITELVSRLKTSGPPDLQQKVVEAMTTNETSFFRDVTCFEALRATILPELMERRKATKTIEIWSAACSTGQEPYSIAMVIREHFSGFKDWKIKIVATDISKHVLCRAIQGRYSQMEVNRGLPAALLIKYFTKIGTEWQIHEEVRRMVEFREMNLVGSHWNITSADIIFIRNVLIYFDIPTKKAILQKIRSVLRPDGFLFLGGSETTMNLDENFERVSQDRSCCYRLKKR